MRPRAKCLTTAVHPHVGRDIDRVVVLNRHVHRDQCAGNVDGPRTGQRQPADLTDNVVGETPQDRSERMAANLHDHLWSLVSCALVDEGVATDWSPCSWAEEPVGLALTLVAPEPEGLLYLAARLVHHVVA